MELMNIQSIGLILQILINKIILIKKITVQTIYIQPCHKMSSCHYL